MTKQAKDDLEAVRVIVDALDGFESRDQERILRWAREKLGLSVTSTEPRSQARTDGVPIHASISPITPGPDPLDIRAFVEMKNPNSDPQFAATIAYYYRFEAPSELRKESIIAEDLIDACRQAGRRRIKHARQTLINAHSQGLFNRGERGHYEISTVGENLVALALPTTGSKQTHTRSTKKKAKRKKA